MAIESFGAAFGVPSDLMFNGRFASKSTSQLSLLNSTVSQLAKSVNMVLTMAYRDIYGEGGTEDPVQLTLLTSPLAATEEVINLFTSGLAPVEVALPAALHAIGANKDEIDAAVEKALKEEEKKCACEDEDRALQTEERKVSIEQRKAALEASREAPEGGSGSGSGSASKPAPNDGNGKDQ